MKQSVLKIGIAIIAVSALLASCYPQGAQYIEDFDVVYTIKPFDDFDFTKAQTFHLADTVMDLSDENAPNPIGNGDDILKNVKQNMLAYGYTEVPDTSDIKDQADYIVLCSVTRSNNYVQTWWPGWGGWWGGWWGGCCYYPPVTTVSNYRTGSVLVQIIDVEGLDINDEIIPVIWQGTLEGLFEGSSQNIEARAEKGINQMFTQSPYLKR